MMLSSSLVKMAKTATTKAFRTRCIIAQKLHSNGINDINYLSRSSLLSQGSSSKFVRSISSSRPVYMSADNDGKQKDFDIDNEDEPVSNEADLAKEKVQVSKEVEEIVDQILKLNVVELSQLSNLFAERLGIDKVDMSASFGGGGGQEESEEAGEAEAPEEEKTAFDLKLTGFDAKSKIKVIKEVRAITGLGLKEAKALVEGAPTTMKKDIKKEEAEELKAKMEAIGATVEIE